MSDRYFLDTNILIYSFNRTETGKNEISTRLIKRALEERTGLISFQVVQGCQILCVNGIARQEPCPQKQYLRKMLSQNQRESPYPPFTMGTGLLLRNET